MRWLAKSRLIGSDAQRTSERTNRLEGDAGSTEMELLLTSVVAILLVVIFILGLLIVRLMQR